MHVRSFASGKFIVTGEYALVFGRRGVAMPTQKGVECIWTEGPGAKGVHIVINGTEHDARLGTYLRSIVDRIDPQKKLTGMLKLQNDLPLGKGMGSSTAFVIAIGKCLLSASGVTEPRLRDEILAIEDAVNPGHSGIDFATIWENAPLLFAKGTKPERIALKQTFTPTFIDAGSPNESTSELVAWVKKKYESGDTRTIDAIQTIGDCTDRLLGGEDLPPIIRDHHRAQVALGVVPHETQSLIKKIEQEGGAAKVLGAGARTGGGGMVLALGIKK